MTIMFLQASVILSMEGVGACMAKKGSVHHRGGMCGQGGGADMVNGGHLW